MTLKQSTHILTGSGLSMKLWLRLRFRCSLEVPSGGIHIQHPKGWNYSECLVDAVRKIRRHRSQIPDTFQNLWHAFQERTDRRFHHRSSSSWWSPENNFGTRWIRFRLCAKHIEAFATSAFFETLQWIPVSVKGWAKQTFCENLPCSVKQF